MVAVPPLTAAPDEPDGLLLPLELQPEAISPIVATPATAARRSLRLHRFIWRSLSDAAYACLAVPVQAERSGYPCTRGPAPAAAACRATPLSRLRSVLSVVSATRKFPWLNVTASYRYQRRPRLSGDCHADVTPLLSR